VTFPSVLPLITDPVPLGELWPEVESHIHTLFPGASSRPVDSALVESLSSESISDTAGEAIVDLLSIYTAHPANLLADCALQTFIPLLLRDEPIAIKAVKALLEGEEGDQECALMLVDSAARRNETLVEVFKSSLERLVDSPSIALRLVARRLVGRKDIRARHGDAVSSMPALYELVLPPSTETETISSDSERSAFDFLPETDDPYQLLKIKLIEIKWAASEAELPLENLVQRAAQLTRKLAPEDRWARLGEKWLRNHLNTADLRYPYRRPRSTIARRAFFHLIGELVDLQILSASSIGEMKPVLDYYDPEMFFIKPDPTPDFVNQMPDRDQASVDVAPAKTEFPKLVTDRGFVILGEYSKVRRLQWELPTVVTQTMIAASNTSAGAERESFFPREIYWLRHDYAKLSSGHSPTPIVIWEEGRMRMFDSPNPVWLALNPAVARSLGWSPSQDLLFGWLDQEGHPAVWSVWWKDGIYGTPPPRLHESVAEGWAVLSTKKALTQVQAEFGVPLVQFRRIERSHFENREPKVSVRREHVELTVD
jgi:hypothetical protein